VKELRIKHDEISNPQTITQRNIKEFEKHGLDIHQHEVKEIVDDHERGERIIKVKNTKYYGPWKSRG